MAEHIFEMEIALLIQMKTSEHRSPASLFWLEAKYFAIASKQEKSRIWEKKILFIPSIFNIFWDVYIHKNKVNYKLLFSFEINLSDYLARSP